MERSFTHIHFIGIKGVLLSALALIAKGLDYTVTGSDVPETFITDTSLTAAGITPMVGFSADHLGSTVDLVVASAAYAADNPELVVTKERNIPTWTASELLSYFAKQQKTLAIAGTHGKTTTTSAVAFLLHGAGVDPSYVIGTGEVSGLPAHGAAGKGEYFVTEADDYKRAAHDPTPKFLDFQPYGAIITSIEHDHPDLYPTLRDCIDAFYQFALRVDPKGFLIVNGDDPNIAKLRVRLADRRFMSYGFGEDVDYRIVLSQTKAEEPIRFGLVTRTHEYGPFTISLRGTHNVSNLAAAIIMALEVGASESTIRKLLPEFKTVERRYQVIGQFNDSVVIDDYAHHPTSVRLTLETARQQYGHQPIWCLFQPHTYSRTKALLKEFGEAFEAADVVLVTDIFASAREQEATVTAQDLVAEIGKHHKNVMYVPRDKALSFVQKNLPAQSVLLTMGAGDIYQVGQALVADQSADKAKEVAHA